MPDQNGVIEVKDFSFDLTPKKFRIDPDTFYAAPELPFGLAATVAKFKDMSEEDAPEKLLQFFDAILLDDSAARLRERATSKVEPVPMRLCMPIINWLFEVYGLRPTPPSEPSSSTSGAPDGSTSSTAGAPSTDSTGPDSPFTES